MSYSFSVYDSVDSTSRGTFEVHSLTDIILVTYESTNKSFMTLHMKNGQSFLVRYAASGQTNEDFLALWGA